MSQANFTIELNQDETALVKAMKFDPLAFKGNHQGFLANAELAYELTTSLLKRQGIPEHRQRYFTDPDYNPSGRGRSRMGGFERNGTSGDEILRHPHFLQYLRYFIHGADLPIAVMRAYEAAVERCGPITSGDIPELGATARQLARTHGLEGSSAADEFYKLSLDLGLCADNAARIRESVRQLRSRR